MSRGQTWSNKEILCLLEIWADEHISKLLEKTHKNTVVFGMFSEKMKERGFERSTEQCRVKVKKLRQTYMKVRDALKKSGASGEEKDQCPWFDELDKILGTRPTVCPVDILETNSSTDPSSPENTSSSTSCYSGEAEVNDNKDTAEPSDDTTDVEDHITDVEDHSAAPSCDEPNKTKKEKLAVRGAQARRHLGRKRKAEASTSDCGLQAYIVQQTKQLQQMFEAEQNRQAQESTALESLLKAQQEAEDRRFQMMQAQQQAHTQMVSQIMGTVVNMLSFSNPAQNHSTQHSQYHPQQAPTPIHWLPTGSSRYPPPTRSTPSSTWSHLQSPVSQTQHPTQPMQSPTADGEAQNDTANQPVSDILQQVNYNQHFYDL